MALKLLEDLGCEVVDNIPIALCADLISEKVTQHPLGIGLDLRTRDFSTEKFHHCVEMIRKKNIVRVVFLNASTQVLCARYRETRRGHPLGNAAYIEGLIEREKKLLDSVQNRADVVFDTSTFSPPEMRSKLQQLLEIPSLQLWVYLLSFSFRRGIPLQSDFVFDMRFLPNPHYNHDMRTLTGEHGYIQSYLMQDSKFNSFFEHVTYLFSSVILPSYTQDRRLNSTLSFGCTGGRHRSVGTAELVAKFLKETNNMNVLVYHRDL
ncbi:glmZ(sRNA)-inactivating NTPase [Holospora curviuscula]|uniref:GlmZ(SRNA)-inactivating NTPase n=2 Tax=Holospora curviuscula TaxID=1082868 RepID=A0A2S5R978_9PROT|nr:glmZ(sRNA)-inactivating NTPase [Holospora curviuscula]